MANADLVTRYRLIAELLLNPEERDAVMVDALRASLAEAMPEVDAKLAEFLADPGSRSRNEYIQTLELSPPCPLYLGSYLYDEPSTCNGVASSGRNAFMIELSGMYRHFGFDLAGKELPDYLPAMVDFLWISMEQHAADSIGLRRRFVEQYVKPGLKPFQEMLAKYDSPYELLVSALEKAVDEDLDRTMDGPSWLPPEDRSSDAVALPVLGDSGTGTAGRKSLDSRVEIRT